MDQPTLAVRVRTTKGKGAARKLRKNNQIPAVFYGPKAEPIMLAVDYPELTRIMKMGKGENILLDLEVHWDQETEVKKVMLKDLSIDPVNNTFLHADFYEISMDKKLTVDIPIRLINTPAGVTNGGILQQVRREVTATCLPGSLIDAIEVDVSGLEIGDAIHISDLRIPEGIAVSDEDHLTIATVAAPIVSEELEEEEEITEEAEGEEAEAPEEKAEEA